MKSKTQALPRLRVAICGCAGMNGYRGKLHGKTVKPYGQPLSIFQGRVSASRHDKELREPHRRHHIFFDFQNDHGTPFEYWVEVWDIQDNRIYYNQDNMRWKRPPTVAQVLVGIERVIKMNVPEGDFKAWLERMMPFPKTKRKLRPRARKPR